jgi:hypothetical protein
LVDAREARIARPSPGGEVTRLKSTVRDQIALDVIAERSGVERKVEDDVVVNDDSGLRPALG